MIKFTFETDATIGATPPCIKILNEVIELKEGISQWSVDIPDSGHLSIDFFSKVESDTVVDHTGKIVKDTQFKINKLWVDGILVEIWFKNLSVYRPRYFEGFLNLVPDAPSEIIAPYQFNFPGIIEWNWKPEFWDWYFEEKNNREVINFVSLDPDRVWKFRGDVDPCTDLVEKIKKIINI